EPDHGRTPAADPVVVEVAGRACRSPVVRERPSPRGHADLAAGRFLVAASGVGPFRQAQRVDFWSWFAPVPTLRASLPTHVHTADSRRRPDLPAHPWRDRYLRRGRTKCATAPS